MADDRIDLVDWCDVAAVGMVARDWFDDFREEHCVRALLAHESHAFCKGLSVYQPNMDRIAAALREAHEAGRIEAQSSTNRSLRREVAAWNAVARWLRGQEEVGLFVLDDGRFGVFFTGNISCAPDDWYPSIPALAEALGLEVNDV